MCKLKAEIHLPYSPKYSNSLTLRWFHFQQQFCSFYKSTYIFISFNYKKTALLAVFGLFLVQTILLVETINPTIGLSEFLLTGVEGMGVG
ncbi:hypothetical protein LPCP272_01681 [Lacticaseibacillus paracasei]|nr:hypothetical protein LPCP272_01681 [Lacticaseibacillus paracasei]